VLKCAKVCAKVCKSVAYAKVKNKGKLTKFTVSYVYLWQD